MGRARTKSSKATHVVIKASAEERKTAPSIPSLLEKAQSLIVQCDYELAKRFVQRVLEREPNHSQGKEMLGVLQLETGDIDAAKLVSRKESAVWFHNGRAEKLYRTSRHFNRCFPHTKMLCHLRLHLLIYTWLS